MFGVDGEQFRRCLHGQQIHDYRAPVATLRDEARVAQTLHQLKGGAGNTLGPPATFRRLARRTRNPESMG